MTTSLITYANRPITQPTRENVLEDAVIDLLQPQLSKAIEDHYGDIIYILLQLSCCFSLIKKLYFFLK